MANQRALLEQAKGALLRLPHVAFVHVLAPDGSVLTSSNQKFVVDGRADARASWALASSELQTRRSDLPGTVEVAAPFQGAYGRAAVLWLGYDTAQVTRAGAGG
jgi:hypothetical protein